MKIDISLVKYIKKPVFRVIVIEKGQRVSKKAYSIISFCELEGISWDEVGSSS